MKAVYLPPESACPLDPNIYQSEGWSRIAEKELIDSYRLFIDDPDQHAQLYAHILVYPMGFWGNSLYIPRGPLVDGTPTMDLWRRFRQEIQLLCASTRSHFCIIEPEYSPHDLSVGLRHIAIPASKQRLPHQTQKINTTLDPSHILGEMKSKTRYNIKLAQKKGVKTSIVSSKDPEFNTLFDQFYEILIDTSKRGKFHIHSKDHYRYLVTTHTADFDPLLMIASHEDDILAANLLVETPSEIVYLHGGSTNRKRNLMAPYLIQWAGIEYAINTGKLWYDFWGTSDSRDSWSGLTKFKRGFGGETINYPGSRAIVRNNLIFQLYQWHTRLRS